MTPDSPRPLPTEDLLAHAGFVRGLARALVSGDADVDDVVQETWLAALASSGPRIRSPRAWLASLVRSRAARRHRTQARLDRRHAAGARSVQVPTPEDLAARHELIQRVSAALGTLAVPYRDALVLRYYDDLPPREVARRLEIPVETARTRVRRGLVRLRELLDATHEGRRAAWAAPLAGLASSVPPVAGGAAIVVGGGVLAALLLAGVFVVPRLLGASGAPRETVSGSTVLPREPAVLVGRRPSDDERPAGVSDEEPESAVVATDPSEDVASATVSVPVRVLDEEDRPVEGIEILERYSTSSGLKTRPLGRSDRDGLARVLVPEGKVVLVTGKDERWHCGEVLVLPRDLQSPVFRVVGLTTVQGTVLTIAGNPSFGTRILARYLDRSSVEGVPNAVSLPCDPTDAEGRFSLKVPRYVRKVSLWGILSEGGAVTLDFDPQEQPEVTLRPTPPDSAPQIRGTVVDAEGRSVDEVLVQALPLDGGRSTGSELGRGGFALFVSSPGRYLVLVEPFLTTGLARPAPLEVVAPVDDVRIVCPPGAKLSGRLLGDDVGDFRVTWIRHRGRDPRLHVEQEVESDAAGAFAFQGLADGDSLLFAYRDGDDRYGLVERPRLDGEVLSLALREGLSVRGRVAGYRGRHGFDLYVGCAWRGPTRWARVEDEGSFEVIGLPPGSYRLRYWRGDLQADVGQDTVAGAAGLEVALPGEVLDMGIVAPEDR